MKDFKTYLREKGNSEKSIKTKRFNLNQLLDWCEKEDIMIESFSYKDMMRYLEATKAKGVQPSTQKHLLSNLKDYFTYLVKSEQRSDHPIAHVKIHGAKKNHLYRILEESELAAIYREYELEVPPSQKGAHVHQQSKFSKKRNKNMLGMMVFQGLTNGELCRIRMEDLKLREGKVYIRSSRKSQERILKLETEQLFELMEYVKEDRETIMELQQIESEQVFFSYQGGNLDVAIVKMMRKLRAQYPKLESTKQIRASVITNWLKRHNLRQVQYMAGHRVITSTEQYLINEITSLQEDINLFNPF